ncbi:hypothetical protein [Pseudomonas sp. MWU12-3103b]|uniref:hypothetical protein n=1 Tax=Pseudomonas sp. MWU12-3103b TaxID=2928857 RepID=UPI001FFEBC1A|nr:hypothetical protein [Pseudomonas sp. MWU12-3103b]
MKKGNEAFGGKKDDCAIRRGWVPVVVVVLGVLGSLGSVGFCFYVYGYLLVLIASLIMALSFSLGVVGYSVYSFQGSKKAWCGWQGLLSIAVSFFCSFLFLLIFLSFVLCFKYLISMVWSGATDTLRFSLLVGFFTLVVGGFLFLVRLKWRATYGLSEVGVGFLIASHRAYGEQVLNNVNSDFYLAVLVGGIYLVVRGLDNFYQGRELEKDPVMKLISWVRSNAPITNFEKN